MSLNLDIEQVKQVLTASDLIASWQVLIQDETSDRALYRIRCHLLRPGYRLEFRLIATENDTIYSYQIFTDRPLIRWDNAPHFPALDTFPHHVHQENGAVEEAHLSGDPIQDLPLILSQVRAFLAKPSV